MAGCCLLGVLREICYGDVRHDDPWAGTMARMIETQRLRLRHWRLEDRPFVAAILGDRDVMEFSETGALDKADQDVWLTTATAAGQSGPLPGMMAIERKRDEEIIGYISLSCDLNRVDRGDAEIGFRLAKHAWTRGYATEAAGGIIEAARGYPVIERIVAIVDPNNHPSVHVLKKAGMAFERDIAFDGYDYPDHLYVRDLTR